MKFQRCLAGLVFAALSVSPVPAAEYPERNITVIVPFPPGGASDQTARLIVPKLAERVKQSVIIDNRAGANGALGATALKQAPADGYTLLVGSIGVFAINPALFKDLRYDPQKDFDLLSHRYNPRLMNKTLVGILCGLGAASIWGGMYVVSKVVLDIIPPFSLVSLRLLLGASYTGNRADHTRVSHDHSKTILAGDGCWLCWLWHLAQPPVPGNKIIHRGQRLAGHFCNPRLCAHLCMDITQGKDYSSQANSAPPGNIGRGRGNRPTFGAT